MEIPKDTPSKTVEKLKFSLIRFKNAHNLDSNEHVQEESKEIIEILIKIKNNLKSSVGSKKHENKAKEITGEFITKNILIYLVACYPYLDINMYMDVATILSYVIKNESENLYQDPTFIYNLLKNYDSLFSIHSLYLCAKSKKLCELILKCNNFLNLFKTMKSSSKEMILNKTPSEIAFEIIDKVTQVDKELFTKYMLYNYDFFFNQYFEVLGLSDITKKINALVLLKKILNNLDYPLKYKFLSDMDNLQIIFNTLKIDDSKIKQGSYDILFLFLLNPCKSTQFITFIKENNYLTEVLSQNINNESETQSFLLEKINLIQASS